MAASRLADPLAAAAPGRAQRLAELTAGGQGGVCYRPHRAAYRVLRLLTSSAPSPPVLYDWPPGRRGGPGVRIWEAAVQHILALSGCALVVRHWFEIDLDDASMEHGARVELRLLTAQPHRGSESAAQLITADRPLWRADLFDRLTDPPGSFAVAHYHPEFSGHEPCDRTWDPELTASPWSWLGDQISHLGASPDRKAWPLEPADATQLSGLAEDVVTMAQRFAPDRCGSASQCFALTRDARQSVQLMIEYLRRPDLLDLDRIAPWTPAT